jgi:hypothetical protein
MRIFWTMLLILLVQSSCSAYDDHSSFLLKLSNDTYKSLIKADTGSGLPNDWYNDSGNGTYCSPEEAGFYMLSHIGAAENNFISKNVAKERIEKTLKKLKGLPTDQGLYYRYYRTDGTMDDKNVPSIGNAMLAASLMTISKWADESNFKEISENSSSILKGINLAVFYDSSSKLFYHDLMSKDKRNYWNYYSDEGRLLSLVAYSLGNINESEFRNNLAKLNQSDLYYNISTGDTNRIGKTGRDILVKRTSWDGSIFTYLAPSLFINETQTIYQETTINPAVYAQIVYADRSGFRLNGTTVWGISDAYTNADYCSEYCGAPPTVASTYHNPYQDCPGLVAPYASALALLSAYSDNATENLETLGRLPSLYDDKYGFKDAFNAKSGSVTDRFVTLDQEWIFLALMDKLHGTLWRYFYQNPEVVAAHKIMYP